MVSAASLGTAGVVALAAGTVCLTSGCSNLGYYAQSVGGHLAIVRSAKPVPDWLADDATPAALKQRLQLTQRIRDYAVTELGEPDNASYRRYADLQRGAAVWNVVAAPELSLTLQTWCFPVVGCVGYRGLLPFDGFADPLLNTFIDYPEGELARLIFHELAHQIAFAKGDTVFNESFATAVERIGSARWLVERADAKAREDAEHSEARRADFRALTARYRDEFNTLYRSAASDDAKRAGKAALMARLRTDYARLKSERWGGFSGYDGWLARANNASFGVLAAYDELVPDFERLFEREGRDFTRFYAEVKRLAALPENERRAGLR